MRAWRPSFAFAALVLRAVPSRADAASICVRESEEAQLARDAGQFTQARSLFVSCARPECPTVVRRDCADFLVELERRLPTVVLAVRTARGEDVADVRVTMDGRPLAERVGALAIPLDPGTHAFRFEAPGFATVEKSVIVREGEKARQVEVTLRALVDEAATIHPPPAPPPDARATGRIPALSWVFGAAAVASGAGFGVLSLLAVDEAETLERTCAPRCSDEAIRPVETKFTVARVLGGVALASAAFAVIFYALREKPRPRAMTMLTF
jgi:hypothetical protein